MDFPCNRQVPSSLSSLCYTGWAPHLRLDGDFWHGPSISQLLQMNHCNVDNQRQISSQNDSPACADCKLTRARKWRRTGDTCTFQILCHSAISLCDGKGSKPRLIALDSESTGTGMEGLSDVPVCGVWTWVFQSRASGRQNRHVPSAYQAPQMLVRVSRFHSKVVVDFGKLWSIPALTLTLDSSKCGRGMCRVWDQRYARHRSFHHLYPLLGQPVVPVHPNQTFKVGKEQFVRPLCSKLCKKKNFTWCQCESIQSSYIPSHPHPQLVHCNQTNALCKMTCIITAIGMNSKVNNMN